MFTGLLFYAYVGIHQVRTLVFDNYQTCTVPLKTWNGTLKCSRDTIRMEAAFDTRYTRIQGSATTLYVH